MYSKGQRGRPPLTPRTPFGRFLRSARNKHGLTRDDVADALGCLPNNVSRIEHGTRKVKMEDLSVLSKAYKVPSFVLLREFQKHE